MIFSRIHRYSRLRALGWAAYQRGRPFVFVLKNPTGSTMTTSAYVITRHNNRTITSVRAPWWIRIGRWFAARIWWW